SCGLAGVSGLAATSGLAGGSGLGSGMTAGGGLPSVIAASSCRYWICNLISLSIRRCWSSIFLSRRSRSALVTVGGGAGRLRGWRGRGGGCAGGARGGGWPGRSGRPGRVRTVLFQEGHPGRRGDDLMGNAGGPAVPAVVGVLGFDGSVGADAHPAPAGRPP